VEPAPGCDPSKCSELQRVAASCSEHVQVDAGMATVSLGEACSDLNAENAIFAKE
jgi:hypothetical protein